MRSPVDAKARSSPPARFGSCLLGHPLPASVQNLFQKMVLFLIVSSRRFLTALGGVV